VAGEEEQEREQEQVQVSMYSLSCKIQTQNRLNTSIPGADALALDPNIRVLYLREEILYA
jgi:hypothetical protein